MERDKETETQWIVNGPESFHWAVWDDEEDAVLFHQGSGDTLLVNPLAELILRELQKNPKSKADIALAASRYFDIENDEKLESSIRSTLNAFRTLGLVIRDSL